MKISREKKDLVKRMWSIFIYFISPLIYLVLILLL